MKTLRTALPLLTLAALVATLLPAPVTAGATGSRVILRNQSPSSDPNCSEYTSDAQYIYYDCTNPDQVCKVDTATGSYSCAPMCECYSYNSQGYCTLVGPPGCAT